MYTLSILSIGVDIFKLCSRNTSTKGNNSQIHLLELWPLSTARHLMMAKLSRQLKLEHCTNVIYSTFFLQFLNCNIIFMILIEYANWIKAKLSQSLSRRESAQTQNFNIGYLMLTASETVYVLNRRETVHVSQAYNIVVK